MLQASGKLIAAFSQTCYDGASGPEQKHHHGVHTLFKLYTSVMLEHEQVSEKTTPVLAS